MPAGPARLIRLCLDLNVWVAAFLAERRGRRTGSSTWLVDAVRSGACAAGPVQLVVSVGMLERLQTVLVREFRLDPDIAMALTARIENLAAEVLPEITRICCSAVPASCRCAMRKTGAFSRSRWPGRLTSWRRPIWPTSPGRISPPSAIGRAPWSTGHRRRPRC